MDPRQEVREFLLSRRARLNPDAVGLPPALGRRRVPGLRRDEVAVLAGVSSEYYARIERGDLSGVSDSVLDALSRALRLSDDEQLHLRNLAGTWRAQSGKRSTPARCASVRPSIQRLLDAMDGCPAYVRDAQMDIVASNALARELHAPVFRFANDTGTAANTARFAFLDPAGPDFFVDWEQVTHDCVASLHVTAGHSPHDKALTELIGELSTRSEVFRTLWATQDVRVHSKGIKRFRHPDIGTIALDYDVMLLATTPELRLVAYSAEAGSTARDSLSLLASLRATRSEAQRQQ